MMKSHIIGFVLCCVGLLNAQEVIENKNITTIVFQNRNDITFFKQLSNGKFNEIELDLDFGDEVDAFSYEFGTDDYEQSINEIADSNDFLLQVTDIKPIFLEKLIQKLEKQSFSAIQDDTRYTYFLGHPAAFVRLMYNLDDDDFKKYKRKLYGDFNEVDSDYINYYFIHFGDNRYIVILNDEGVIFNTPRGLQMIGFDVEKLRTYRKNPICRKNLNWLTKLKNRRLISMPRLEYFPILTPNKKYELQNIFGRNVLSAAYDTIHLKNYFIIGQNTNQLEVYNFFLEKLPITNAISVYAYKNRVEVIENNQLKFYDLHGKPVSKHKAKAYKPTIMMTCGLIPTPQYELKSDKYDTHYLNVRKYFDLKTDHYQDFIITNIDKSAKVQFIDDEELSIYGYSSDTKMRYLVLVNHNDKYGLYAFENLDFSGQAVTIKKEEYDSNEIIYPTQTIELEILLPIEFDNITSKEGRIHFSKGNLYGILEITNQAQWTDVKQVTRNYYRITHQNGRKGWLSYYERKIFWDK